MSAFPELNHKIRNPAYAHGTSYSCLTRSYKKLIVQHHHNIIPQKWCGVSLCAATALSARICDGSLNENAPKYVEINSQRHSAQTILRRIRRKTEYRAWQLLSHWQTNVRMIYPFCTRIRHVSQCTILGNFTLRMSTNEFYCRVCECSRICANIFYCIQLQLLFCLRWFYREYLNNDFDYQYYPGNSNHPGFQDIWCQNFIWILSGKLMIRGSKLLEKKFAQLF